jgi:hypothetical protein
MARHPLAYSSNNLATLGAAVLSHLLNKPVLYVSGEADFQFVFLHGCIHWVILCPFQGYRTSSLLSTPYWGIKDPMIRSAAPDMKVRLSADLRQKIEGASGRNNRTMNSEIVARLEQSFREEGVPVSPLPFADHEERLAKMEQVIISMLVDERFETLVNRVSALEKLLSDLSS